MALTGDTGNGATLTFAGNMGFGTQTTSVQAITIAQGKQSVAVVDVSTLATTDCMESIPSDLRAVEESTVTFKWLTSAATSVAQNVNLPGGAGTITLTYPARSGETTAATYTGTGFITGLTPPTLQNGELQTGELTFKYDGDTGPTYTGAS